jgi:large subunit ribosomal protein L35
MKATAKIKTKTKKAASKRMKVTSTGKLLIGHVNTSHLKTKQSRRTKRRKGIKELLSKSDTRRVMQVLPYLKKA